MLVAGQVPRLRWSYSSAFPTYLGWIDIWLKNLPVENYFSCLLVRGKICVKPWCDNVFAHFACSRDRKGFAERYMEYSIKAYGQVYAYNISKK